MDAARHRRQRRVRLGETGLEQIDGWSCPVPLPPPEAGPQPVGMAPARRYDDAHFFGLTCEEQEVEQALRLARGQEVPGLEASPEPEEEP